MGNGIVENCGDGVIEASAKEKKVKEAAEADLYSAFIRLDALVLSVIATATWLAGWVAGCHTPVLYQNR